MLRSSLLLACLLACSAANAQPGCAAKPNAKPDIEGNYLDNFGGPQEVMDRFWISGQLIFKICSVDNTKGQIIAWNGDADDDPYNPGKFSRFDWIKKANRLWYCQIVFDAQTEADAQAAAPPDAKDPRIAGCGQSEWSSMARTSP